MTGYDFDKTIYDGDCFIDFYFFTLLHRPYIIIMLPFQLLFFLFTFYNRKLLKQGFACYLLITIDKDILIKNFWNVKAGKIKEWYLAQKKEDDIVISASPNFLISEACKRLGIKNYLATNMSTYTGIIHGKNCYGEEKVRRLQEFDSTLLLDAFYSDSKSDFVMKKVAKEIYLVKNNNITKIK